MKLVIVILRLKGYFLVINIDDIVLLVVVFFELLWMINVIIFLFRLIGFIFYDIKCFIMII